MSACCECPPPESPAPIEQVCALGVPDAPNLPRLYRALNTAPQRKKYPAAPICKKPHALADECEVVDDVDALRGTGFKCDNDTQVRLAPCGGWSRASKLTASNAPPTCGDGACPDLSLDITDPSGVALRLSFYDDVSCHGPPKYPNCPRMGRACYYRVGSVQKL